MHVARAREKTWDLFNFLHLHSWVYRFVHSHPASQSSMTCIKVETIPSNPKRLGASRLCPAHNPTRAYWANSLCSLDVSEGHYTSYMVCSCEGGESLRLYVLVVTLVQLDREEDCALILFQSLFQAPCCSPCGLGLASVRTTLHLCVPQYNNRQVWAGTSALKPPTLFCVLLSWNGVGRVLLQDASLRPDMMETGRLAV